MAGKNVGLEGLSLGALFGGIDRKEPPARPRGTLNQETAARLAQLQQWCQAAGLHLLVAFVGDGYVDFRISNRPYRMWESWNDPRNDRIRDLIGDGVDGGAGSEVTLGDVTVDGPGSFVASPVGVEVRVDEPLSVGTVDRPDDGFDIGNQTVGVDDPERSAERGDADNDPVDVAQELIAAVGGAMAVSVAAAVPVKRTLSAEHLAKLAEGRARARAAKQLKESEQ